MRNHTCLLDHLQRSHYDTITIGPEGMMNWALQLNNNQSVNSFSSLLEKFNMQNNPNQPNQNPNQSVIDRGNLRNCLKTSVLSMLTMEQGNLWSTSAHTMKEQFAPEENRDIASFNADIEFNRTINEENIDFNIPGVPHSAVKQSHGVNVQNLSQKIEKHPQRHALQGDLQQHRQFNLFSKERITRRDKSSWKHRTV